MASFKSMLHMLHKLDSVPVLVGFDKCRAGALGPCDAFVESFKTGFILRYTKSTNASSATSYALSFLFLKSLWVPAVCHVRPHVTQTGIG